MRSSATWDFSALSQAAWAGSSYHFGTAATKYPRQIQEIDQKLSHYTILSAQTGRFYTPCVCCLNNNEKNHHIYRGLSLNVPVKNAHRLKISSHMFRWLPKIHQIYQITHDCWWNTNHVMVAKNYHHFYFYIAIYLNECPKKGAIQNRDKLHTLL